MEGNVTWQAVASVVTLFVLVSGALWTIWWRIEGKVAEGKKAAYLKTDEAKRMADIAVAKAELTAQQFAEYRTHVAETYVSKAGHRESTDQIMKAIGDIGIDMRGIRERLDNFIDRSRKPP